MIMKKKTASIVRTAAAAAAIFLLSLGTWAYITPYAYVSLDVNPSIEYTLNRFERVLSVQAVNDDGQEIVKEIGLDNLRNKTIDDAIAQTVEQINEHDYFQGEGAIVIATSAKDIKKAAALADRLKDEVDDETEGQGQDVDVEAISVGRERVDEARELGVTPGRLNLVEKLRDSYDGEDDFDTEAWLQKPVKDLMAAIKENREVSKADLNAYNEEQTEERQTEKQEQKQEAQADKQEQKQEAQADKQQQKEQAQTDKQDQKDIKDALKSETKEQKDAAKADADLEKEALKETQQEVREEAKTQKKESQAESKEAKDQNKVNQGNSKK